MNHLIGKFCTEKGKPVKYKEKPHIRAVFNVGRGTKIRTQKNGFGDRYVTITSCPCVQMGL